MVSRHRLIPAAFALATVVAGLVPAPADEAGEVTLAAGGLRLSLSRTTGQPVTGGLTLTEGPQATPVLLGPTEDWQRTADGVTFTRRETAGGLSLSVALRGAEALQVDVGLRHTGTTPRLLEVRFALPLQGRALQWWDGRYAAAPRPIATAAGDIGLRLPLSVGWGARGGLAVGLDPHRLLSGFGTGAEVIADGLLLSFGTRVVVDPGQTVTLPLWACAFTPTFGHLDAVQRWIDLFPDMFAMARGVRPSLVGGGGYLLSRLTTRELQWEQARRFGLGWEWAYCPAQTPGDWYADERFYDPQKGYAGQTDAHRNQVQGSLEDYRRDMRERFRRGWWATNLAYYMLPHAADESVLARFADGVIKNAAGEPDKLLAGWIKPDANTRMTYPWGNSYGQEVVREIGQIADDFGPSAIGFDEAYGGAPQYGAGIDGEPARTWDDAGKAFASTQVALAHLGEAIHGIQVRGYTLAAIFNKPTSYDTATRCDVGMHEHPPYENIDAIVPLRLLLGHKPMSWWSPLKYDAILRRDLAPQELHEGIAGMVAFLRLSSLRYGAFPMGHQVWGNRQIVTLMPVLAELLRQGWQPTPGAEGHADLWLARYGSGVMSFLVAGNPKREARPGKLTVLTRYLGPGHFLFGDYAGRPLSATSAAGQGELDLGSLGKHEHRIARALVQLVPATEVRVSGTAQTTWQPLSEGTTTATWTLDQATSGTLMARLPEGARALSVTLNGQACKFVASGDLVRTEGALPAQGELQVTWQPAVRATATRAELLGFSFEQNGAARAKIELPANPTEHDTYLAQFLRAYFDYWYRRRQDPFGAVADLAKVAPACVLDIVPAATAPSAGPRVVIRHGGGPAKIALEASGPTVVLSGDSTDQRESAVRRLLEVLDEKYPYMGVYPESPLFRRAGLVGKTLD